MKRFLGLLAVIFITSTANVAYGQVKELPGYLSPFFSKDSYYIANEGRVHIVDGEMGLLASGTGDILDLKSLKITYIKDATVYTVGEKGEAGIVFFDKGYWSIEEGRGFWRYLEADTSDAPTGAFTDHSFAYTWDNAKTYCNDLSEGGHENWFLPKIDELGKMYDLREKIGGFKTSADDYPWYWSSSEFDYDDAWFQYFNVGYQYLNYKVYHISVRCARAITTI